MATVRSLLGIICLSICGGFVEPSSDFLVIKVEVEVEIEVEVEVENKTEVEYVGLTVKGVNRFGENCKLQTAYRDLVRGVNVEGLVAMLCSDQNSLSIAKNHCQSSVPAQSKKQQYNRAISTAKPQTQWFCEKRCSYFDFLLPNKTKCQCFFDAGGFVKRHLRVIDKHFCILFMLQKCEAFLNTYKNINEGEKLEALWHRANDKLNANNSIYIGGKKFAIKRIEDATNRLSILRVNRKLRTPSSELQTKILDIAQSQLGIREATGKNDGAAVEAYLSYTGNKKGEPWCASFVSWVYGKAGLGQPKTAWSPALFPLARQTLHPLPADVFGIYFPSLKRVAHGGLVEASIGNWVQTIEGNTNAEGAREGDGVYRKLRHKRTIAVYANWLIHLKKGDKNEKI